MSSVTLERLIESFVSKLKVRQILTESIEFTGEDARLFVEVSLLYCVEFNSEVGGGEGFNLKKEEIDTCFFVSYLLILQH